MRRRCLDWAALGSLLLAPSCLSYHAQWEAGREHGYSWFHQGWVDDVRSMYCDDACNERLLQASTIDSEFKALVDIFNRTTGGPRDVYRGAFEGIDEMHTSGGALSRRAASKNTWKHMNGWDSILSAHTSTLTLCTELKLDGNVTFTRSFCYDSINASSTGPRLPDPRWSVIEDCCLKFNRTVNARAKMK